MTADEIRALWDARDDRYGWLQQPLTQSAVWAVRHGRAREARALVDSHQSAACILQAAHWEPPMLRAERRAW